MINNKYAKAYVEVLEMLKYFPKEEYDKIPREKIKFYKENMDENYIFTINPEISLEQQNISLEANAIIINLFIDYFATEKQKNKIKEILELNQNKSENEKKEKYNPELLFKKQTQKESIQVKLDENINAITQYEEPFFTKFKNFIFKILHIN